VSALSEAKEHQPAFDEAYVRAQFPAFSEPALEGFVHAENAGGSYACAPVIERLDRFYRQTKLQPYYPSAPSLAGGEAMDEARTRFAAWMGIDQRELHFGPSTTQNTYVLAQALRRWMQPGDEVIITNQDHEANCGAFRRLADEGFVVREWQVDPQSGELDGAGLDALLNERTRAVAFTHCSNIVGSVNPVRRWCEKIRAVGAMSIVDGVSYAPHGIPQPRDLGADVYLYSLYKVYGPHLGVMALAADWNERLPNQGHFFNADNPLARFTPAGPDHAQIAAAAGVLEYFERLDRHHFADPAARPSESARRVHGLLERREAELVAPLLDWLSTRDDLRLIGKPSSAGRAPTVSLDVTGHDPQALCEALAGQGVGTGYGNFYAYRLMEGLGIDPARGVLRCSFVHYNTAEEVAQLVSLLDETLAH
jgi:selenocysteine lyase/cysteine desulfurase